MLVLQHIFITTAIGVVAFFMKEITFLELGVFSIGGIVIDMDHILSYWYYKKEYTLSYTKVKNWCFSIGYRMEHFYLLHTFWFLLLLFLLRQQHRYLMLIFFGVLIHMLLDVLYDLYWYYILKKNLRPYRRWVAPVSWLKKIRLEKYL